MSVCLCVRPSGLFCQIFTGVQRAWHQFWIHMSRQLRLRRVIEDRIYWLGIRRKSALKRLGVLPFDPHRNFTSIFMSGFFSPLQKHIFRSIQKRLKIGNFQKSKNFKENHDFFLENFRFLKILFFFSVFRLFSKKMIDRSIFWKVEKSGHQYRSKISLRIEWEHSQPLKPTLKHS